MRSVAVCRTSTAEGSFDGSIELGGILKVSIDSSHGSFGGFHTEKNQPGVSGPVPSIPLEPSSYEQFLESGTFYGTEKFNPAKIVTELIFLQSLFYTTLCSLNLVILGVLEFPRSIRIIFESSFFSNDLTYSRGTVSIILILTTAIILGAVTAPVVERNKKCLDYVASVFTFHLLCSWTVAGSFPTAWSFWGVCIVGVAIATLVAEALCTRKELQEIVLRKRQTSLQSPEAAEESALCCAAGVAATSGSNEADVRERATLGVEMV